jgi:lysyl-tRNA synthetase class 2
MTEEILNEEKSRLERLTNIKNTGINPYPALAKRTHTISQTKTLPENTPVIITGRLVSQRQMGKLSFCHLKDFSDKIQIAISEKELGKESFKFFTKNFDLGDFLQIEGEIFTTHKGELSILVKNYTLLSKSLLPLPEKFHGLNDVEIRYRKRYLDLLANKNSMAIAKLRSQIVKELRNYFDNLGFYEVETPILQTLYGGANAEPFVTHHNTLDIPLFLRIAPELYLKRLIIGGFEKVYEIARCFRNEGVDNNHNPEFTQIEFYWAYANYHDLMNLMEDLLPKLIISAGLPLKFKIGKEEVDFTPPYPRKTMRDIIKEYAEFDIEDYPDQISMFKKAVDLKIDGIDKNTGRGKVIDEIYKVYARPKIIDPIFMIDHPIELSPLAKRKADDKKYAERMQLVCIGGNELCNGFSELNDPIDQEERFLEQERLVVAGDKEGMKYDEDFVEALRQGMPPTAGLGMGIDRLIKILTDSDNLKEVILFPTLKPIKK